MGVGSTHSDASSRDITACHVALKSFSICCSTCDSSCKCISIFLCQSKKSIRGFQTLLKQLLAHILNLLHWSSGIFLLLFCAHFIDEVGGGIHTVLLTVCVVISFDYDNYKVSLFFSGLYSYGSSSTAYFKLNM